MIIASTSPADPGDHASARGCTAAVLLLAVAALGLRLPGLDRSLTVDEAWTITQAAAPDFWTTARNDVHPPLYYYLVRLAQNFTTSAAGLRLLSVGCGLGLLALAVFCFRKRTAAVITAGAVVAALPGFVLYSQQLRSYSLLLLLLAAALLLAVRIFRGTPGRCTSLLLSLLLMAAAATHLVTVFFLPALAPLLLRPAWAAGPRGWLSALLPLVAPGLLAIGLKFFFITPPGSLAGGWWIPVDAAAILNASREVFGWTEMQWLADAWSRHAPGGGWPVLAGAVAAALFATGTAWGRRQNDPLAGMLLASAAVYCATVLAYSWLFEPVIMMRTLLPGLLPFLAGLAWGIGTHPVAWRRVAATTAVVLYATLAAVPVARLAALPDAGLRQLAAATNSACRPGDLVVTFRAMDYSLAVYASPPAGADVLHFDQTGPAAPQLAELRHRLARLDPRSRVLVVYRDDHYLRQFHAVFDEAIVTIARHSRAPGIAWSDPELVLLVAEPAS